MPIPIARLVLKLICEALFGFFKFLEVKPIVIISPLPNFGVQGLAPLPRLNVGLQDPAANDGCAAQQLESFGSVEFAEILVEGS